MHPWLIPTLLVAIAIEVLFPLLLGLWLQRRLRVPWKFFGYGALVFGVAEGARMLLVILPGSFVPASWSVSPAFPFVWIAILALTAGLFEEGGRYLGYRFLWKSEKKDWARGLMYGAGHGGLESMLLVGGLTVLSLIEIIALSQVNPATLPSDQALQMYQAQETVAAILWWEPLVAAAERLMTLVVQISLSLLVLQVFTRGRAGWWWLALGYHTLVDLAVLLLQFFTAPILPHWAEVLLLEGLVLIFALLSAAIVYWLRVASPPGPPELAGDVAGTGMPAAL